MGAGSMADQLKHFFDEGVVRSIASDLSRACPAFRADEFTCACMAGLAELELTARARHIAGAMADHLPGPFAADAAILLASLGPEAPSNGETGFGSFRYLPHVFFVQSRGLDDFEAAMEAQYELTKRFTAEWSIRAFLVRHPDATYARLREWAGDRNVHVRRLVSEGTRPRLPWAPRLRAFQQDPRPVLALLELLKDDPERYVQRSVANNLNDIAKDHPDLTVAVCRDWSTDAPPGRAWTVRHALRSLVKAGHPGALRILGAGDEPRVSIDRVELAPPATELGGTLRFSFEIASIAAEAQDLVVDYAVHYVKANGGTRPKVFKLRRIALEPAARLTLGGTISFRDLTTRRHYPGRHRIELLINGVRRPLAAFDVHAGAA